MQLVDVNGPPGCHPFLNEISTRLCEGAIGVHITIITYTNTNTRLTSCRMRVVLVPRTADLFFYNGPERRRIVVLRTALC